MRVTEIWDDAEDHRTFFEPATPAARRRGIEQDRRSAQRAGAFII
jgi:hypothetical protein